jgi:hypothetical protein
MPSPLQRGENTGVRRKDKIKNPDTVKSKKLVKCKEIW